MFVSFKPCTQSSSSQAMVTHTHTRRRQPELVGAYKRERGLSKTEGPGGPKQHTSEAHGWTTGYLRRACFIIPGGLRLSRRSAQTSVGLPRRLGLLLPLPSTRSSTQHVLRFAPFPSQTLGPRRGRRPAGDVGNEKLTQPRIGSV